MADHIDNSAAEQAQDMDMEDPADDGMLDPADILEVIEVEGAG